jgi:shikimate kinase
MTPTLPTLPEPTLTEPMLPEDRGGAAPGKVLLVGMMGCGKSSTGHMVANRLGWPYLDSDQQVQAKTGHTVAQIFAERGEGAFRAEEAEALAVAVNQQGPLVVAVAAGAVLSADNRRLLRQGGLVVWLRAELTTLATRVVNGSHRPLLAGDRLARLTVLYADRRPHYQELADLVIDVDHLSASEVADQVVAAVHSKAVHPTAVHPTAVHSTAIHSVGDNSA